MKKIPGSSTKSKEKKKEKIDKYIIPIRTTLEVPSYLLSHNKDKLTIFDMNVPDKAEIGTIRELENYLDLFPISPYIYISRDFIVLDIRNDKMVTITKDDVPMLASASATAKADEFFTLPQPTRYQYVNKDPDIPFTSTGLERESEVEILIAPSSDNLIRIWTLTWTIDTLTIVRDKDINIKDLGLGNNIGDVNIIPIGKDIIILWNYNKIIYYSLGRRKILMKYEDENIDKVFIYPNGKLGMITDNRTSIIDIRIGSTGKLEGTKEITTFEEEFYAGYDTYHMISKDNDDFYFIYEPQDRSNDIKVYTITSKNELKYEFNFTETVGNRNTYIQIGIGNLIIFSIIENKKSYIYDLNKRKVIHEIDRMPLDIRVGSDVLLYHTEKKGYLINESGDKIKELIIKDKLTEYITISKREKEVLKTFIESNLSGYVAKPLTKIVSKFIAM